MKKYIAFFIISAIILGVGTVYAADRFGEEKAEAVSTPYAVIGEDVWMLNENGSKLFLLPRTYYARIDRMDDNFYYITFNGVSGKIPKASVSVVGYDKDVKDTQRIIRISTEYSVFTEIKLKASLDGEAGEDITAPTSEPLTYIGTYKQGESIWYYVSYGGAYGYVLNTYTDTPTIVDEEFVPEKDITEEAKPPEEEKEEQPELVKILVISGVSVAVLILVIILFIPRKNKKHKYYYS